MKTSSISRTMWCASLVLAGVLAAACGKDSAPSGSTGGPDSGTPPDLDAGSSGTGGAGGNPGADSGPGGATGSDCFTNPTTHFEIINACTTAQKVDKNPNLPLLADGGLPQLP